MASLQDAGGSQATMLTQLLGPLIAQTFSYKASLTFRNFLTRAPSTIVSPHSIVKQACTLIAPAQKAVLVVDNGELVNIFGFKDMMSRTVSTVMIPNPEIISPEISVIEAL